ncbi:hypothetical protein GCM10008957_18970 [Deinococcus ruber]|uniref:Uncharacterized protein n=1 Tax=Deinococcus ruber TaxID=1848197 RepID=A0A918C539_9DEIO|nr:hypothetical protein GCM10008957_18970 [Deinococcus ruber]
MLDYRERLWKRCLKATQRGGYQHPENASVPELRGQSAAELSILFSQGGCLLHGKKQP